MAATADSRCLNVKLFPIQHLNIPAASWKQRPIVCRNPVSGALIGSEPVASVSGISSALIEAQPAVRSMSSEVAKTSLPSTWLVLRSRCAPHHADGLTAPCRRAAGATVASCSPLCWSSRLPAAAAASSARRSAACASPAGSWLSYSRSTEDQSELSSTPHLSHMVTTRRWGVVFALRGSVLQWRVLLWWYNLFHVNIYKLHKQRV